MFSTQNFTNSPEERGQSPNYVFTCYLHNLMTCFESTDSSEERKQVLRSVPKVLLILLGYVDRAPTPTSLITLKTQYVLQLQTTLSKTFLWFLPPPRTDFVVIFKNKLRGKFN